MHIRSASNTNEINWDDPLNKGLVSWYSFNQKGGNVLRDVVGKYHGTLDSSMTSDDWVASPETNSLALDFDGINDDVATGVSSEGWTQLSLFCWVWAEASTQADNYASFLYNQAENVGFFQDAGINRFLVRLDTDTGATTIDFNNEDFCTGEWRHVGLTWDGASLRTHLNGQWTGYSGASTGTIDGAGQYVIGSSSGGGNFWNGKVSDVRIYDRGLSDSEVRGLYQASRTGYVDQYKRRYFPVSLQPLTLLEKIRSVAKPTTTRALSLKKNSAPSYKAGYAKSASESAYPELWDGMSGAWIPQMGQSGDMLLDLSGHGNNGNFVSSPEWRMKDGRQSLFFDGVDDRVDIANVEFGTEFTAIIAKKTSGSSSPSKYMLAGENGGSIQWILWQYTGNTSWNHSGSEVRTDLKTGYRVVAGTHQPTNLNELYQSAASSPGKITVRDSGTFEYTGTNKGSLIIGGRTSDNNRNWEGHVYAVLFYKRALTSNELRIVRADPLAPFRKKTLTIGYQPSKELRGLFRT